MPRRWKCRVCGCRSKDRNDDCERCGCHNWVRVRVRRTSLPVAEPEPDPEEAGEPEPEAPPQPSLIRLLLRCLVGPALWVCAARGVAAFCGW